VDLIHKNFMQYNTTLLTVRSPSAPKTTSDNTRCNFEKQISPKVVSQEHLK